MRITLDFKALRDQRTAREHATFSVGGDLSRRCIGRDRPGCLGRGPARILTVVREASMYRVRDIQRDQWMIVDDRDQTVFVGTKRQAEDWLDYQENAQRRAKRSGKALISVPESKSRNPDRPREQFRLRFN
jgi:hypothetical protein